MLLSSHLENGKNFLSIPTIIKPDLLWTGKQLISLIIPRINLSRVSLSHSEELCSDLSYNDTRVLIINGELLSGIIDKRTIGASNGSIIHVIWKEYGPEETTQFISQFQVIVNNWLIWNGFSVGIGDTISSSEINKNVYKIIHSAKKKVELVAKKDLINFKENLSNKIIRDTLHYVYLFFFFQT
jgi:DNA-directed RNA polymerase II subunit RPB1